MAGSQDTTAAGLTCCAIQVAAWPRSTASCRSAAGSDCCGCGVFCARVAVGADWTEADVGPGRITSATDSAVARPTMTSTERPTSFLRPRLSNQRRSVVIMTFGHDGCSAIATPQRTHVGERGPSQGVSGPYDLLSFQPKSGIVVLL